jgi:hypothetical protein
LRILFFNSFIHFKSAIKILGIKPSANGHNSRGDIFKILARIPGFPEIIIIGMRKDIIPESDTIAEVFWADVFYIPG